MEDVVKVSKKLGTLFTTLKKYKCEKKNVEHAQMFFANLENVKSKMTQNLSYIFVFTLHEC